MNFNYSKFKRCNKIAMFYFQKEECQLKPKIVEILVISSIKLNLNSKTKSQTLGSPELKFKAKLYIYNI